jgi:carboxypeptidase PM20D1
MLDEGLFIIDGLIPGHKKPIAMVCVAEKGYATFKLSVSVDPGHSSAPPKETAIGILAKAV